MTDLKVDQRSRQEFIKDELLNNEAEWDTTPTKNSNKSSFIKTK